VHFIISHKNVQHYIFVNSFYVKAVTNQKNHPVFTPVQQQKDMLGTRRMLVTVQTWKLFMYTILFISQVIKNPGVFTNMDTKCKSLHANMLNYAKTYHRQLHNGCSIH